MDTVAVQSGVCRGLVALLLAAITACSGQQEAAPVDTAVATPSAADAAIPETVSPYDALPEAVRLVMDKPFTGDFDTLVARRAIRVGVTFNRTHYFIDKGQERGLTYESLKLFENDLNADLKTGNLKVHVVIVPMTRTQLYPALSSGKVDMVTVRPELEELAAFSVPTRTNVNEVVVTGPGAPPIASVDDLAGQEVFVRKGSIYEESLGRLNVQLKARGKPAVVIDEAPDVLEDDDVLEMVNAGLVPITVVETTWPSSGARYSPASRCIPPSPYGPEAAWPSRFARRIPSFERPSTRGSESTQRATPSETRSNAAISTTSSTRRTLRRIPSARNCRRWPNCSRSTERSTTSTPCSWRRRGTRSRRWTRT
jgi:ABC-type amino acid transport substrate-binding protein